MLPNGLDEILKGFGVGYLPRLVWVRPIRSIGMRRAPLSRLVSSIFLRSELSSFVSSMLGTELMSSCMSWVKSFLGISDLFGETAIRLRFLGVGEVYRDRLPVCGGLRVLNVVEEFRFKDFLLTLTVEDIPIRGFDLSPGSILVNHKAQYRQVWICSAPHLFYVGQ